ncbi:MAG TPA: diacylglycerol kinase family protein, partial [Burkholderiaceae bacterium]|nr:diacylglycerol kinase family protein [Burkholderiaceae bacterium]
MLAPSTVPATIALIGNRNAGRERAREIGAAIAATLQARGQHVRLRLLSPNESIEAETQAAVRAGARVVAALGGDGTVNTVANA